VAAESASFIVVTVALTAAVAAVKLLDIWKTAACKSKNNYNCAKF